MAFDVSNFELPRVWAIDNKNDVLFNVDGTIAFRRWNQKARAMEIYLSMSRLEAEKLFLCLQAAQHRVRLTASGAGGRGQNSLQSSFIADDPSAKHGGR